MNQPWQNGVGSGDEVPHLPPTPHSSPPSLHTHFQTEWRLVLCDGQLCLGALAVAMVTSIPPQASADWSLYPGCQRGAKVRAGFGQKHPDTHGCERCQGGNRGLLKWRRGQQGAAPWVRIPGLEKSGRFSGPRRVAWASKDAYIPLGLLQGSGPTPPCLSRTRPAARSGQACESSGLAEPAAPRARGGRVWGVSAGRGGGRASNPGAACGSGRIRELAL